MITRILYISFTCISLMVNSYSQDSYNTLYDIDLQCKVHHDKSIILIRDIDDLREKTKCLSLDFDFQEYDIIGISRGTSACGQPKVDFEVIKNNAEEKYYINASIHTFGGCRVNRYCRRFVIIEKMNQDYDIEFSVNTVD